MTEDYKLLNTFTGAGGEGENSCIAMLNAMLNSTRNEVEIDNRNHSIFDVRRCDGFILENINVA